MEGREGRKQKIVKGKGNRERERYADADLAEFKVLIQEKIKKAEKDLHVLTTTRLVVTQRWLAA